MAGRRPTINKDEKTYKKGKKAMEDIKKATPVYQSQEFKPPSTLSPKELEVWNWLVGIFRETINCQVSDADVQLMELYCRAKVATDEADAELKKDPRAYILVPLGKDKDGNIKTTVKPNPNLKKRKENALLCLKFTDQLGLSPLARARVGVKGREAEEEKNIFEQFMRRSDD